jgi:hypothetical protein
VQIVSTSSFLCGIGLDQMVTCWGKIAQNPVPGFFTQLTSNRIAVCGVLVDGSVKCWGGMILR